MRFEQMRQFAWAQRRRGSGLTSTAGPPAEPSTPAQTSSRSKVTASVLMSMTPKPWR
jgi:hypothetical protein